MDTDRGVGIVEEIACEAGQIPSRNGNVKMYCDRFRDVGGPAARNEGG